MPASQLTVSLQLTIKFPITICLEDFEQSFKSKIGLFVVNVIQLNVSDHWLTNWKFVIHFQVVYLHYFIAQFLIIPLTNFIILFNLIILYLIPLFLSKINVYSKIFLNNILYNE